MANLNFAVAVKLLENGFSAGASRVRSALRSIQFQAIAMASALGAGAMSLGDLFSRMRDVARQAGQARTALSNVSSSASEYAKSIKFLNELSAEFGTDLISTTGAFAKFTAAATASGIAMQEQQKIFTSVARAITAFGLGGEEAKLTFYAISQMMAKGRISAEELRRQLGERVPVAMEAMAKAAGVPIEQLDGLLKKGALLSRDILPKFAEELNNLLPSVSTDNLEASINRLKNSFLSLTDDLGIYDKMKKIVDATKDLVEFIKEHFQAIGAAIIGGLAGYKLHSAVGGMYRRAKGQILLEHNKAIREAEQANKKAVDAMRAHRKPIVANRQASQRVDGLMGQALGAKQAKIDQLTKAHGEAYEKMSSQVGVYSRAHKDAQRQLDAIKSKAEALRDTSDRAYRRATSVAKGDVSHPMHPLNYSKDRFRADTLANYRAQMSGGLSQQIQAAEERAAKAKAQRLKLTQRLWREHGESIKRIEAAKASDLTKYHKGYADAVRRSSVALANMQAAQADRLRAIEAARATRLQVIEARKAAQSVSSMQVIGRVAKSVLGGVATFAKSVASAFLFTAALSALSAFVSKMIQARDEAKRLLNLHKDFVEEVQGLDGGSEAEWLRSQLAIIQDKGSATEKVANAIESVISKLGIESEVQARISGQVDSQRAKQEAVIDIINRQIQALEAKARVEHAINKKIEAEERAKEINRARASSGARTISDKDLDAYIKYKRGIDALPEAPLDGNPRLAGQRTRQRRELTKKFSAETGLDIGRNFWGNESDDHKALIELYQLSKIIEEADNITKKNQEVVNGLSAKVSQSSISADASTEKSDLQKAEEKFVEEYRELGNKLKQRVITEDEYSDMLQKLAQETREAIAGELGGGANRNRVFQQASLLYNADFDYIKAQREHSENVSKSSRLLGLGIISQDDHIRAVAQSAQKELEALGVKEALTDVDRERIAHLKEQVEADSEYSRAQREHAASVAALNRQRKLGILSEEQYNEALRGAIASTLAKLGNVPNLTLEQEQGIMALRGSAPEVPFKGRDKTFDYQHIGKGKESNIIKEDLSHLEQYVDKLKEALGEAHPEVQRLKEEAKTLEQAFKAKRIAEDIDDLKKSLGKGGYEGIKEIATSADRLGQSFRSLKEAFDPASNASGWERFFSAFNSIAQVIDSLMSVVQMIETMTTATQALTAAQQAQGATATATAATTVASSTASAAATTAGSAKEVAARGAVATAATTEAAAKTMAAHAYLPFVGIAIGAAAIGVMLASIAKSSKSVPKFANGGIVPGTSFSGDKVLVGVNSGELILNAAQQKRVAGALVSQGGMPSQLTVEVVGRISGDDIVVSSSRTKRKHAR